MNTIHGYPVLERRTLGDVSDVVLVFRPGYEFDKYVTGLVFTAEPEPTEWVWGHYSSSIERAVADLNERCDAAHDLNVEAARYQRD